MSFVYITKNLILNVGDIIELGWDNKIIENGANVLSYYTKVCGFSIVAYYGKKYWQVDCTDIVSLINDAKNAPLEKTGFINFENIRSVMFDLDNDKETKSKILIKEEEVHEGYLLKIKDNYQKKNFRFQVAEKYCYGKDLRLRGYLYKGDEEYRPLIKQEGRVSSIVDVKDVTEILVKAVRMADKNGKKVKPGIVVKFENRLGDVLYKYIERVEESEAVIKLWGGETCNSKAEAKESHTKESGYVFAHDVEIV